MQGDRFKINKTKVFYTVENMVTIFVTGNFSYLDSRLEVLERECIDALNKQGFSSQNIKCEAYLNLRYQGTDCALMCTPVKDEQTCKSSSCKYGNFKQAFLNRSVYYFYCLIT